MALSEGRFVRRDASINKDITGLVLRQIMRRQKKNHG